MIIKIKKTNEKAIIPIYAKSGDAAMDLIATEVNIVDEHNYAYIEYNTGLNIEIPEGYVGLIFPRSSISNTGLIQANSVGVIDSGYRGDIKIRFKYIKGAKKYNVGDKVAQLMISPYPYIEFKEVEELSETDRGEGGFGSTGK